MKRFALACALGFAALGTSLPAHAALSPNGQAILDYVRAHGDINTACKTTASIKTAITTAIDALVKAGKLPDQEKTLRAAGNEAGRRMYFNCGRL